MIYRALTLFVLAVLPLLGLTAIAFWYDLAPEGDWPYLRLLLLLATTVGCVVWYWSIATVLENKRERAALIRWVETGVWR